MTLLLMGWERDWVWVWATLVNIFVTLWGAKADADAIKTMQDGRNFIFVLDCTKHKLIIVTRTIDCPLIVCVSSQASLELLKKKKPSQSCRHEDTIRTSSKSGR
jgi:hypothetical protein